MTSPHSSITTLLVNFGIVFFSLHHHLLHRLCFTRSIRQKMLCREERSLLSWGKRQKAWKLAAIGFTRREVWADFQDFWSNLIYFCKNHSEFVKYSVLAMYRVKWHGKQDQAWPQKCCQKISDSCIDLAWTLNLHIFNKQCNYNVGWGKKTPAV